MPARTRTETTKTKAATTAKATRGKSTTAARGKATPANGHGTKLVIVESPSKARTIAGYLGQGYVVESSVGHIRDMPDSAAEIPAKYRGEPWARLGVDVDHNFEPLFVVHSDKRQQVSKLKSLLKDADELLLATDEDREGEAIAWHLLEELKPKVPHSRMVFHESPRRRSPGPSPTRARWTTAWSTPTRRRRVLDRLYGYNEVSPVSCGRRSCPSCPPGEACSRSPPGWWSTGAGPDRVPRRHLLGPRGRVRDQGPARRPTSPPASPPAWSPWTAAGSPRAATSPRWASSRPPTTTATGVLHLDAEAAAALAQRLENAAFAVSSVAASSDPALAVRAVPHHDAAAGGLAQAGLLGQAHDVDRAAAVRERPHHLYAHRLGDAVPDRDQRGPQAGRRAVRRELRAGRPAHLRQQGGECRRRTRPSARRDSFILNQVRSELSSDQRRLYELIWQRTVASQMKDATGESVSVRVAGTSTGNERAEFGATGKVINFYGFLKAYVEDTDDAADRDDRERRLPPLAESDPLDVLRLAPAEHSTRPPAATPRRRWSRSWKTGRSACCSCTRPSSARSWTAATCSRRAPGGPSFLAFAVVTLLERHFGQLVDYEFTAHMEDVLDEIARGGSRTGAVAAPVLLRHPPRRGRRRRPRPEVLGGRHQRHRRPRGQLVPAGRLNRGPGRPVRPVPGTDGQRVNVPEDIAPDELTVEKAEELFNAAERLPCLSAPTRGQRPRGGRQGRRAPDVTELLPRAADAPVFGQAEDRLAAEVHGVGHGHAGRTR